MSNLTQNTVKLITFTYDAEQQFGPFETTELNLARS